MFVKMVTLNGEEVDCEDVNDLNAVEQQRVFHLVLDTKSFIVRCCKKL